MAVRDLGIDMEEVETVKLSQDQVAWLITHAARDRLSPVVGRMARELHEMDDSESKEQMLLILGDELGWPDG